MEQELFTANLLPYIEGWSCFIVVLLLAAAYHLWRFSKKHPEVMQHQTKDETQETAKWRRQYYNRSLISSSIILVWAVGMGFICVPTPKAQAILSLIVLLILIWIFFGLKRKPRK